MNRYVTIILLALLGSTLSVAAQDAAPGTASVEPPTAGYKLVITYDRPGLDVPHWQVTVPPRGMAQYTGVPTRGTDPGIVLFRISERGRARLGSMLRHSNGLAPCETKVKGIANMGTKTVDYTPVNGPPAHCVFNYTDNKALGEAANYILALTDTVQTGLELERLHRYDRLGLDPVILRFADAVKEGHAVEISAIRPTLEGLVTDMAVLERVRTRAQQLLELANQQEAAVP